VVGTFFVHGQTTCIIESQNSPQPGFGGSQHLPLYNILCAWPRGLHPNVILSQDSQVESLQIPEIKTLATLKAHNNFFEDL